MSSGANCYVVEAKAGDWYLQIQKYPYGETEAYEIVGPFASSDATLAYMRENFQNPGSYHTIPFETQTEWTAEVLAKAVAPKVKRYWSRLAY